MRKTIKKTMCKAEKILIEHAINKDAIKENENNIFMCIDSHEHCHNDPIMNRMKSYREEYYKKHFKWQTWMICMKVCKVVKEDDIQLAELWDNRKILNKEKGRLTKLLYKTGKELQIEENPKIGP